MLHSPPPSSASGTAVFRNELGLGGHDGAPCCRLGQLIPGRGAWRLGADGGQHQLLHKLLDKGGLAAAHRPHHARCRMSPPVRAPISRQTAAARFVPALPKCSPLSSHLKALWKKFMRRREELVLCKAAHHRQNHTFFKKIQKNCKNLLTRLPYPSIISHVAGASVGKRRSISGCSAVLVARLNGVQEAVSSILATRTINPTISR